MYLLTSAYPFQILNTILRILRCCTRNIFDGWNAYLKCGFYGRINSEILNRVFGLGRFETKNEKGENSRHETIRWETFAFRRNWKLCQKSPYLMWKLRRNLIPTTVPKTTKIKNNHVENLGLKFALKSSPRKQKYIVYVLWKLRPRWKPCRNMLWSNCQIQRWKLHRKLPQNSTLIISRKTAPKT